MNLIKRFTVKKYLTYKKTLNSTCEKHWTHEKHSNVNTAWKVSLFIVFLVRIFTHSGWIRTRKTPFYAVKMHSTYKNHSTLSKYSTLENHSRFSNHNYFSQRCFLLRYLLPCHMNEHVAVITFWQKTKNLVLEQYCIVFTLLRFKWATIKTYFRHCDISTKALWSTLCLSLCCNVSL